jgi:hypothetical protein
MITLTDGQVSIRRDEHSIRQGRRAMPFTYEASASPSGNTNIRRVCSNAKCGGVFYITYNAQNYRCPHCKYAQ